MKIPYIVIVLVVLILVAFVVWFYSSSPSSPPSYSYDKMIQEIKTRFPVNNETVFRDLQKMQQIQAYYRDRPVPYLSNLTYKELFWLEDTAQDFSLYDWIAENYQTKYGLKTEAHPLLLEIHDRFFDDIMRAKEAVNKPRPHVWSKRLNIPIEYVLVESATSTSIPSGHAVQGFLFGCLFYRENRSFFDSRPEELAFLAMTTGDHGLCRVIGGVHFPDDYKAALVMAEAAMQGESVEPMLHSYKERVKQMESFFSRGI